MGCEIQTEAIYNDLELLKRDIAVIKHVLLEEGELTAEAKKRLAEARKTPRSLYISNEDLKKRFLK